MPARPFHPDGPFTTGDLARMFHLSPRTISTWCDDGLIESYKVPGGRHRRVTRASLESFLARHPTLPRPVEITV